MESTTPDNEVITFPTPNGHVFFKIGSIIYFEGANSQCTVFLTGIKPKIIISKSLKECEEKLKDKGFIRTHNCYLVNYHHIVEYFRGKGGVLEMSNGAELNVGATKKQLLLDKIAW